MKTLVLFTGGLDSTYMLWKILAETDDEIFAHRVRENPFNSPLTIAEDGVAFRITEWLQKYMRPFEYSTTLIEFPRPRSSADRVMPRLYPHVECAFVAATLILNGWADRVVSGRTMEEQNPTGVFKHGISRDIFRTMMEFGGPTNRGVDIKYDPEPNSPLGKKLFTYWDWPLRKIGRPVMFAELPMELLELVLFCSHPKFINSTEWVACKECRACIRYPRIVKKMAKGVDWAKISEEEIKIKKGGKYAEFKLDRKKRCDDDPLPKTNLFDLDKLATEINPEKLKKIVALLK